MKFARGPKRRFFVIPEEAGIRYPQRLTKYLDPVFNGVTILVCEEYKDGVTDL